MGLPARKREERFTYGDYLKWPNEERWELIYLNHRKVNFFVDIDTSL